jgi:hypothetical protein
VDVSTYLRVGTLFLGIVAGLDIFEFDSTSSFCLIMLVGFGGCFFLGVEEEILVIHVTLWADFFFRGCFYS